MKSWMLIVTVLLLSSCSSSYEKPMVISTNIWIGSAPLYYAHAMGWLQDANIEMLQADSIEENLKMYNEHASDIVTGTQHEYLRLKKSHKDLIPVILYDRSFGGDVILSNQSLRQLIESKEKIDLYVELDTVSEDMLEYFLTDHNFTKNRFTFYSRNQEEIERMKIVSSEEKMVVVTYNPHDTILKQRGFRELANSANDAYVIVDGFYLSKTVHKEHEKQLKELKELMDKAIAAYGQNPKAFYTTVKPYLGNPSYEEFQDMLANVRWMNNAQLSPLMRQRLNAVHYPTSDLIE